jgi:hypothetical protein
LHSFQRQSTERVRLSRLQDQRAIICPISKHSFGHLPRQRPSVVLIGFASMPSLVPDRGTDALHAGMRQQGKMASGAVCGKLIPAPLCGEGIPISMQVFDYACDEFCAAQCTPQMYSHGIRVA